MTSGFVYPSAEEAAAAFDGETDHFIYSRYGNPTVATFEERMALLEGAEAAFATASGMAAVFASLASSVHSGDRIVAARSLFGSCFVILDEILPRWGVTTDFVDGGDLHQWERALAEPAALVFFETPSNPMQELVDIRAVADLAHAAGAKVIVDNVFATPVLQSPLTLGADVVVYSATKHIDGQGRVLGGVALGSEEWVLETLQPFMRHTGPSMSPFNAWVLTKALETMRLRVEHQSANARTIALRLEEAAGVERVWYPTLASHDQHELATSQMSGGGTVVTFSVGGGSERAFRLLNALEMVDISNNLGDAKSIITHPESTTHRRLGPEVRAAMGITPGIVRLSVGLEDIEDIWDDLSSALGASH
ncbi:MAG: O-succinylhomoserine sulfhydrylase [Acidimicrobiia bacterium]|nr:O-succinylhomoserine sulfhydrylase [Acidimicrobiia bacterium]